MDNKINTYIFIIDNLLLLMFGLMGKTDATWTNRRYKYPSIAEQCVTVKTGFKHINPNSVM